MVIAVSYQIVLVFAFNLTAKLTSDSGHYGQPWSQNVTLISALVQFISEVLGATSTLSTSGVGGTTIVGRGWPHEKGGGLKSVSGPPRKESHTPDRPRQAS